jgi:hypothetical protein
MNALFHAGFATSFEAYFQTGLPDFPWYNIPKRGKYTKLSQNTYTKVPKNIPNRRKMDQMAISIFHCKTLQNLPKFDIWFKNIPSGNPAFNVRTAEKLLIPFSINKVL